MSEIIPGRMVTEMPTANEVFNDDKLMIIQNNVSKQVDSSVFGNTFGKQADFEVSDVNDPSYIKNKPDLTVYVEKVPGKDLSDNNFTDERIEELENKVDKVEGKELSDVNFTLDLADKLLTIQEGAEVNPDFKTINNESIIGEGNITIETIINDTLESTSITEALSANQGRELKELIDNKIDEHAKEYTDPDIANNIFVLDTKQNLIYKGNRTINISLLEKSPQLTYATTYIHITNTGTNNITITLPNTDRYQCLMDSIIMLEPTESVQITIKGYGTDRKLYYIHSNGSSFVNNLLIGLIFRPPVATVAALTTTYPNAEKGWASLVTATGTIHQFNGTAWYNTGLKNFPDTYITDLAKKVDKENILNVSKEYNNYNYPSKTAARNAVAVSLRSLGQIITYKLTTGWVTEQYIGADVNGWAGDTNWKTVGDSLPPAIINVSALTGNYQLNLGRALPLVEENLRKIGLIVRFSAYQGVYTPLKSYIQRNKAFQSNGYIINGASHDMVYMYPVVAGTRYTFVADAPFGSYWKTYANEGYTQPSIRNWSEVPSNEISFTAQTGENFVCFYTRNDVSPKHNATDRNMSRFKAHEDESQYPDPKNYVSLNKNFQANGNITTGTIGDIVLYYPVVAGKTYHFEADTVFRASFKTYASNADLNQTAIRNLTTELLSKHTFTAQTGENFVCFYTRLQYEANNFNATATIRIALNTTPIITDEYEFTGSNLNEFLDTTKWEDRNTSGGGSSDPMRIASFYNVKYWGAKGDGVTDDAPSIQDAVDWVTANGGGTLFFPKGIYQLTRLHTRNNVTAHIVIPVNNTSEYIRTNCLIKLVGEGTVDTASAYASTVNLPPASARVWTNGTVLRSSILGTKQTTASAVPVSVLASDGISLGLGIPYDIWNRNNIQIQDLAVQVKTEENSYPRLTGINMAYCMSLRMNNVLVYSSESLITQIGPSTDGACTAGIVFPMRNCNPEQEYMNVYVKGGFRYGMIFGEHNQGTNLSVWCAETAYAFSLGGHTNVFQRLHAQNCKTILECLTETTMGCPAGWTFIDIQAIGVEPNQDVKPFDFNYETFLKDPNNKMRGQFTYHITGGTEDRGNDKYVAIGGSNVRAISLY